MFWDNFVRLCNRVDKYPNTVAAEVGVKSTGTVTGWKNGAMPRQSVLKKLCDYFDVTETELLGDATCQKENAPGSDAESEIYKLLAQATPLQTEVINEILNMNTNQLNALKKLMDAANALAE